MKNVLQGVRRKQKDPGEAELELHPFLWGKECLEGKTPEGTSQDTKPDWAGGTWRLSSFEQWGTKGSYVHREERFPSLISSRSV